MDCVLLVAHILDNDGGANTALTLVSLAAMIIPFIALGFLARFFLRAGREDEAGGGAAAPAPTDRPARPSPGR